MCETKQLFTRSEAVLNSLIGDGKCQGLGKRITSGSVET